MERDGAGVRSELVDDGLRRLIHVAVDDDHLEGRWGAPEEAGERCAETLGPPQRGDNDGQGHGTRGERQGSRARAASLADALSGGTADLARDRPRGALPVVRRRLDPQAQPEHPAGAQLAPRGGRHAQRGGAFGARQGQPPARELPAAEGRRDAHAAHPAEPDADAQAAQARRQALAPSSAPAGAARARPAAIRGQGPVRPESASAAGSGCGTRTDGALARSALSHTQRATDGVP